MTTASSSRDCPAAVVKRRRFFGADGAVRNGKVFFVFGKVRALVRVFVEAFAEMFADVVEVYIYKLYKIYKNINIAIKFSMKR